MSGHYVIMGVSGCGKNQIGLAFAKAIDAVFIDGDDLHPKANIDKMRSGEALDDSDRAPWLDQVGAALQPGNRVIACSALKRIYRDRIVRNAGAPVMFLFLGGSRATLLKRVSNRPGHFMPATLLDSQLATLEAPAADEAHVIADIDQKPEDIVALFQNGVKER